MHSFRGGTQKGGAGVMFYPVDALRYTSASVDAGGEETINHRFITARSTLAADDFYFQPALLLLNGSRFYRGQRLPPVCPAAVALILMPT